MKKTARAAGHTHDHRNCVEDALAAAEKLCAEENNRRNYDGNFSGYADNLIFPVDCDEYERDLLNNRSLYVDGYIVNRKVG